MLFQKSSESEDLSSSGLSLNTSLAAQESSRNLAASPVGSPPALSASPYKSTFSSFFRSSTTPEPVAEDQAAQLSPSLPAVNTSAEALVRLENCLDGLKRRPSRGENPSSSSQAADATPVASPSTITDTMGLSIHTERSDADERRTVDGDLANACGWIFTGLVLEIVSLASESCRTAEETVKGPIVVGKGHGGNEPIVEDVAEMDGKSEDASMDIHDKGKRRADVSEEAVEPGHAGHRRRRFSLSFNFKGMLNLDDIEERLSEDPQTCADDHDHRTADWDTLVSSFGIKVGTN